MRRVLKLYPIPHDIWQNITRRVLVLKDLDAVQMAHLRELTTWFLDQKSINGAQALKVTTPMRVTVAAQACLLILNLGVEYFDGWIEVILYPGPFRVKHVQIDDIGLVSNDASDLTGEAWLCGPVVLSWEDVERDSFHNHGGHNVVLHEFAHKLDGLNGTMNGMPPLRRSMALTQWSEALCGAYDALRKQVATGESTFINPYAATNPAEFFAVLSEYFFTAPNILKKYCPDAYKQLELFYQQAESRH